MINCFVSRVCNISWGNWSSKWQKIVMQSFFPWLSTLSHCPAQNKIDNNSNHQILWRQVLTVKAVSQLSTGAALVNNIGSLLTRVAQHNSSKTLHLHKSVHFSDGFQHRLLSKRPEVYEVCADVDQVIMQSSKFSVWLYSWQSCSWRQRQTFYIYLWEKTGNFQTFVETLCCSVNDTVANDEWSVSLINITCSEEHCYGDWSTKFWIC